MSEFHTAKGIAECNRQLNIGKLDTKVTDIVFGYIRNVKLSVPNGIALICLSYYYFDDNEYFANAHSDYNTINSEKGISIERVAGPYDANSAFGNVLIPSQFGGVYVWKFKTHLKHWLSSMYIGISSEYEDTNGCFYNITAHNYCLSKGGCFMKNGELPLKLSHCDGFDDNDIVTMTLDLHQRTLKYTCADRFENKGHDDIHCGPKINYKMAILLEDANDKVELIGFSID